MAAMTMDREPEVARFIDTYKFDQEMSTRRDRFGGGTSLPLHSDGYEDKQRSLRDERHRDWLGQQEKPQVVRNSIFLEQKQLEQQKIEARRRSPPRPAQPQGPQIDYNLAGQQAKAEEKRAYQDYMKAKEEQYWQMRGRPVTPPGGLNIGNYDRQLKETAAAKKKEYKEMLDQQQKEHMYLRARQEPEMAVIDRNAPPQHLANKPPAGPGYNRSRDENVPNSGPASELQRKRLPRKRHIEKITEETLNKQVSDRRSSASYYQSPTESNDYVKQEGFDKDVSNGKSPTPKPKVASRKGEIRKTPGPRSNYSYLSDSSYGSPVAYKKRTKLQTIPESPNHKQLGVVNEDEDDSSEEEIIDDEFDRKLPEWLPRSPDSQLEPLVSQSPDGRKKQHKVIYYKRQNDKQTESYVTYMRQNKKHGREGKQANDQRSESQMSNTREFKNDSKSRAIPDRERYGQPPFPGEGHSKAERENKNKDISERKSPVRSPRSPPKSPLRSPPKSPLRSPPKSPLKSPSRRYMSERRQVSDAEHAVEGTPLAFKTESRPIPERPQYGQPPYPGHGQYVPEGEMLNPDAIERPPVGPQPRALEKLSPVWLKPQDDDRPVEGTPLAFKTNSYSRQPPPAPEQAFNGPPAFSNNGQRPIENGMDGFYERPVRTPGRPRSRRSVESERKYAPTNVDSGAQISPRRMKNTFYEDSQEVSSKRIEASKERQKDYNDFIRLKNEEKRRYEEEKHHQQISKPAEVVKNQYYSSDDYEKFQKEIQRKQGEEYRDFLAKKAGETRNRDWNFEQSGVLELHGDEAVQSKQRALRAERQKEYNSYISQLKTPPNHSWPEPAGRGALLVRKGEYDNVRQMYDDQRKREFVDSMQKRREMGLDLPPSTAPPEPLRRSYENTNPMLNVMGRYDDFRRRLVDDRRRDFKSYMDKVKANDTSRHHLISTAPNIAREETPLIHSMGVYDLETRKKVVQERKKDFAEFNHEQQKHWTPRTMVKENLMPHVASAETPLVNYMGKYDKEQLKFRLERNKDLRVYVDKRKRELRNPYDNYVYPTVAVAEKPLVAYMGSDVEQRKRNLREERKRDYEQHKSQQKVKHPDRRHEFVDTASGPYGGLFQGLGDHGNRSEALNKERQREYNEQHAGKEKISGRPNWARDTLPNNTDRGRSSPMKSQPPTDQYQQMLDEKRREEASRRRYDDPEYQGRLAESRERERGEAGPRYGGY